MRFFNGSTLNFIRRWRLDYLAIFVFAAAVYTYIQWQPAFPDPDSFYHMKMAMLTREQGIVKVFPWLPFTTLSGAFADHHYLYHLLLIPFIDVFGPPLGVKVASILFAALAIVAFYALLRAYQLRYAAVFALMMAACGGFIFRLNLAKASALSITLVLLSLIAMRRSNLKALFVMSALFVWLYGGWPIMLILAGAFLAARAVAGVLVRDDRPWHRSVTDFFRRLAGEKRSALRDIWALPEVKNAVIIVAGLLAGLVVNPFFPKNISFYWEQIVQIAIISYRGTVTVGREWYPYSLSEIFGLCSIVFILFSVGLVMLLAAAFWGRPGAVKAGETRRPVTELLASFLLAAFFLAMTIRSRRHMEYFVPFAMLFDAQFINLILPHVDPRRGGDKLMAFLKKARLAVVFVIVYLAAFFPLLAARDVFLVHGSFMRGIPWTTYAGAGQWLAEHTPKNAVIFHNDWDDFPILFYRDDRNRYISGLDQTFLYRQDPLKYAYWLNITTGKRKTVLAEVISGEFGARFVMVKNSNTAMARNVAADPHMHLVYEDSEVKIYAILL